MASPALNRRALPAEPELRAFARAAAALLIERAPRTAGTRPLTRRAGVGIQHLDHREYLPGDDLRHIDWRATARLRRPFVHRFESEAVSDWTIVLDASSSMAIGGAAKWHSAVCAAAAMSHALIEVGHRVGLLVFGARVLAHCPRGRGRQQFAAIARTLTALRPAAAGERSILAGCARHLHGAASVFTISDFLADGEMQRDLGALLAHCSALHALQLRDAADTRLRARGEIDLVDVETGARRPAFADANADAFAARERSAMAQHLRSFCARSGIAYSDWDIAQPWQQTLITHLARARSTC